MRVVQRADDFEFDDDLILDQQVRGPFADDHAIVKDHNSSLLHDADPGFSDLMRKGSSETFSTNPGPSALAT